MDLDYPGLEAVKQAVVAGDLEKAKAELLRYFRTRTNRRLVGFNFPADLEEAGRFSQNRIEVKGYRQDFGDRIDWGFQGPDVEWNRGLNRMKWFLTLAGAYLRSRDERYALAWARQADSWIASCPAGYPRTIDTGRRLENWVLS